MGATCVTQGRDEKCVQNFGRKSEGKNYLKDLRIGLYGRIILDWILGNLAGKVWIG